MSKILTRLARCSKGVSALEFALIAPIMALLVMGGFDLGSIVQQSLRLEAAARAGAQHAFSRPSDTAGIAAAIRANLPGWTDITVPSPVQVCRCPDGTSVSCGGALCGTEPPAIYISVQVSRPFTAITPLSATLAPPTTLRGHVELRLR
jgi:Flp pilus assembly pilin Flp